MHIIGLDSTASFDLLTHLAASNRTAILTIHQPRLEIFHKFNHLVLLTEGKVTIGCISPILHSASFTSQSPVSTPALAYQAYDNQPLIINPAFSQAMTGNDSLEGLSHGYKLKLLAASRSCITEIGKSRGQV